MLIIKRFAGQAIVVETASERFEIAVVTVQEGITRLNVAGNVVDVSKGQEIALDDSRSELLIVVEQIGVRGIRLGFKGDLSRRIYRKEGTTQRA